MKAIYRLVLRTQVTKGRAVALASAAALGLVLALGVSRVNPFDRPRAAYNLVQSYGLNLLVPITALVFASAALGDPAEDGTLVYLWHRPIARSRIAVAAYAAALCAVLPFAVVPTALMAAVTGQGGRLLLASAAAGAIAAVAYTGLFVALGLLVRRALVWGLAYVLIWEGFVARSGTGAARLSILLYARSVLAHLGPGHHHPLLGASMPVAVVVPLVVAVVGVAGTVTLLRRLDIE